MRVTKVESPVPALRNGLHKLEGCGATTSGKVQQNSAGSFFDRAPQRVGFRSHGQPSTGTNALWSG
jgi:hypothetical protein